MSMVNNGLKPKEGEVTSQPWEWPLTFRGQRFTRWGDLDLRIYLLGNPVIYWGALGCLVLLAVLGGVVAAMNKRQLAVRGLASACTSLAYGIQAPAAILGVALALILHCAYRYRAAWLLQRLPQACRPVAGC